MPPPQVHHPVEYARVVARIANEADLTTVDLDDLLPAGLCVFLCVCVGALGKGGRGYALKHDPAALSGVGAMRAAGELIAQRAGGEAAATKGAARMSAPHSHCACGPPHTPRLCRPPGP